LRQGVERWKQRFDKEDHTLRTGTGSENHPPPPIRGDKGC
jgi:hypothetical protein